MTTRRVLYVSPLPPPAGGIANWTRILKERGLPGDWTVDILNTTGDLPVFSRGVSRVRLSQVRRWVRILRDLRQRLHSNPPDVVHLNSSLHPVGMLRDIVCVMMTRQKRIPCVVHYRGGIGGPPQRFSAWMHWHMIRKLAGSATLNIVQTNTCLTLLRTKCGANCSMVCLPNFIDEREVSALRAVPREPDTPREILFVSGLTKAKGADLVIAAAGHLPTMRFALLGRPYRETDIAGKYPENVRLAGEVPHDQVLSAMSRSHVFVLPTSHREGFPNVVCEAMAAGLPVIAYPMGAIADMIDDGTGGIILPDLKVSTLVDAIVSVVENEERRQAMGTHNVRKVDAQYSYSQVTRSLVDSYESILRI